MNRSGSVLFLLLVLLIAAVAGGWAWQFMHGPEYTLVHAARAMNNRNLTKFRTYVDISRLANSLTNQTIARNTNELFGKPATNGLIGSIGRSLANTVADAAKPMMLSQTEETIVQGIEQGSLQAPGGMDNFQGAWVTFVLKRNPEFQVKTVTQQNHQARIRAVVSPNKLNPTKKAKVVVLLLEQQENVWRLIGADLGK